MLSRVEICAKFGLQPLTFDTISEHLACEPVNQHGRSVYKLTPEDEFLLRCGRLHAGSFVSACNGKARLFPFHRFLVLRFLTSSVEEIMAEIDQRRLAPGLDIGAVRYLERMVHSLLPPSIKTLAKKRSAPGKEHKKDYDLMLRVLGIDAPYYHPEWLDNYFAFIGDPDHKVLFEAVMTSRGSVGEWQEAYEALARTEWAATALDLYASIFYDLGYLSDLDWKHYLGLLPPTERNAKRRARGMTTAHLCVLEATAADFQKTMRVAAAALQKKIMAVIEMRIDGLKTLQSLLVSFNNCGKATGEIQQTPKIGVFQNIVVEPAGGTFKTIEDITPGRKAVSQ